MIIIQGSQFGQQIICIIHSDDQRLTGAACENNHGGKTVGGVERMRHRALQNLVGRAIVDRDFRDQLLNGDREQVVSDFDLTDDEMNVISSINAHSLEAFAGELEDWIEVRDEKPSRRRTSIFGS
jgi:hypothetical protein